MATGKWLQKMLTINLNSIKNDSQFFRTELAGHFFNLPEEEIFDHPVMIDLELYRTGEQVVIRGRATTQVELSCSRCLTEFSHDLSAELLFIIQPTPPEFKHSREESVQDQDPGLIICPGDQLDLIPEIRSALLLALPMRPLCTEACKGLCSHCGAELNRGSCRCSPSVRATPFSALKNWPFEKK